MLPQATPQPDELSTALEAFARDLLVLIKTFCVYPQGHPAPLRVAERLVEWSPPNGGAELSLGITPTKLLYADRIFGFEGSRAEAFSQAQTGFRRAWQLGWDLMRQAPD
jgi:hypothetical protein